MMRMREERIGKRMLHIKIENKLPREDPGPDRQTKIENIYKLEGKIRKEYRKTENGRTDTAGDFSLIVAPYPWKRLKKNDDGDDDYDDDDDNDEHRKK